MQRLSGLDASFLYFETRSQLMHVCALFQLDTNTIVGGYSFETLRTELARRVHAVPGLRRKLHDSMLNIDHPVWVEAEDFDIEHHLHRMAVPSPGGDEELAELCAHLAGQPMDRSMPLWEMWVIEGLADGGIAVFAKMHHATVDGMSGANMMSQMCTLEPEDPELDLELVKETAGGSSSLELAVGGAISRLSSPLKIFSLLPQSLAVLPGWLNRARKGLAMPAPFSAPRTPFNRTITGHRSLSFTTLDLAQIKEIKAVFGTTVNDLVLALCSTALRKYLDSLDQLPAKPLVAMVPMSVRGADERPGTNRVSGMFMSLATDIDDPVERLESIRDANIVAKDHNEAIDANLLTDWAQFAAPSVFGAAVRMYSHLRLSDRHPVVHNLIISNVPGPNMPLYFLGGRITRMLPLGPVFHGAGLNATVISLDGKLHVGFIACKEAVPDPWPLARFVDEAMQEYLEVARQRADSVVNAAELEGAAATRKTPAKKAAAKKTAARKPAKKAAAKRTAATKSAATKSTATKTTAKKTAAAKTPARTSATKPTAAKTAATKTAASKPTGSATPQPAAAPAPVAEQTAGPAA